MATFKTFLGQVVQEGDYIAYPGRSGSSVWMNVGKVTKIEPVNWVNSKGETVHSDPILYIQKVLQNSAWSEGIDRGPFKPSKIVALNNVIKLDKWDVASVDDLKDGLLT